MVVLVSENAADSAGRGGAGQYGPGGGTGSLCDEPVGPKGVVTTVVSCGAGGSKVHRCKRYVEIYCRFVSFDTYFANFGGELGEMLPNVMA